MANVLKQELVSNFDDISYRKISEDNKSVGSRASNFFNMVWIKTVANRYHIFVLFISCFLLLGFNYNGDIPGAYGTGHNHTIQTRFAEANLSYTQTMNQNLHAIASYPGMVTPFVTGILIDRYVGVRVALVIFSSFVSLYVFFIYLGIRYKKYGLLAVGAVFQGFSTSLLLSKTTFLARWFHSGGLAPAFAINLAANRLGASLNFLISPRVAKKWGPHNAALVGFFICVFSVFMAVVCVLIDKWAVSKNIIDEEFAVMRRKELRRQRKEGNTRDAASVTNNMDTNRDKEVDLFTEPFVENVSASNTEIPKKKEPSYFRFKDLLNLPIQHWLLAFSCCFGYCCILPFLGIARNLFEVEFHLHGVTATTYVSYFSLVATCAVPFASLVAARFGRSSVWLLTGECCVVLVHLLATFTHMPPYLVIIFLSLSYAVWLQGLWPSVPYIVQPKIVGTAYGTFYCLQSMCFSILSNSFGPILDKNTIRDRPNPLPTRIGYRYLQLIIIIAGVLSSIVSLVLLIVDIRRKGLLFRTAKDRKRVIEERNASIAVTAVEKSVKA